METVWKNPEFDKNVQAAKKVKADECSYCHKRGGAHKPNCKAFARELLKAVKD